MGYLCTFVSARLSLITIPEQVLFKLHLSKKTVEMSESRSDDGIFVFYRIKNSISKKKLEDFERGATANFLRSGFSVEIPMGNHKSRLGFIGFRIVNHYDS